MRQGEEIAFFTKRNHPSGIFTIRTQFARDACNVPSAGRLVKGPLRLSARFHKAKNRLNTRGHLRNEALTQTFCHSNPISIRIKRTAS